LTWTPDGQHLLFSSNRGGTYGLWRIPVAGGEPQPVALSAIGNLREPSLRGEMLAYTESYIDVNIWQYNLRDTASAPTPWMASTRWDADPQFAPDGQRIAFASSRSGHAEIWVADRAESNALQLTSFEGPHTGHPRWSPKGEHLAFDSRDAGNADIYLIGARGGVPRRLTTDPANDLLPSWSSDGAWVYFASNRSGTWQVWKIPAMGGEAVPVTHHGGYAAFESPEGLLVYYSRRDTSGLWHVSPDSKEETLVIDSLDANDWGHWGVTTRGLYFPYASSNTLHRYDFATRQSTPIKSLVHRPSWQQAGIAVDPHGTRLLVTQTDRSYYDIVITAYKP
ncbi:MAG TPA: hypothetical protein VKP65_25260, partial [Rhodothermales bacterium]|nr:hypothetical protein [Rhodothermales bacterium]